MIDLLSTVEYGGCSSKLSATDLKIVLKNMRRVKDDRLLVSIDTGDDAGVYKLTDDLAIIQTTDFFPPICSDPYEFGQIAVANAVSDVFAMGGKVLTALNLVMFPKDKLPLAALTSILRGGADKLEEAGGIIVGGHTIDDYPPKYGLAVTGAVHPDKVITNTAASVGDMLILTKPIGTGVVVAGQRIDNVSQGSYKNALENMKLLNKNASAIMQKYEIRAATDITGFGLLGHAYQMALASKVTFRMHSKQVPLLDSAYELVKTGCIPGACFRNQEYVKAACMFSSDLDYNRKMLMLDAQTSGGLLISVRNEVADDLVSDLRAGNYPSSQIIGQVIPRTRDQIEVE